MRFSRIVLVGLVLLFCLPILAQQTQQSTTQTPAAQDPQAVNVLNQALVVAGGTVAIKGLTDYTATGNITYHWNPEEQGTVTVLALGFDQIRLDANLSRGMQSSVISAGQTATKTEDGKLKRYPSAYPVPSSDAYPYQPRMFPSSLVIPHMQLAAALSDPRFSISYKGIVQLNGISVHDVFVQRVSQGQIQPDSMNEYNTIEVFIDVTTFQIVMTQDNVPKHIIHQIWYSNYRPINGVLVPFSISEQMGGQKTRDIQLSQINFNSGLQNSSFVLE